MPAIAATLVLSACGGSAEPPAPPEPTGPTQAEIDAERDAAAAATAAEEARREAEQLLRAKLPILRASPTIRLRLEGHADERGSTEYNLALGNRRAVAVQEFLADFGISANVFTTTSFGEERPAVNRSDEAAWAQNRRVEFVITGGQIVTSEDN